MNGKSKYLIISALICIFLFPISTFAKSPLKNPPSPGKRDAKAYSNRGLAYNHKGDYDLAISDFTKAIEINPRDAEAYYNRGVAYYHKGNINIEKACGDARQACRLGDCGLLNSLQSKGHCK